ncbi:hypothetical protein ACN47E_003694 [Coniothyrium glycines]
MSDVPVQAQPQQAAGGQQQPSLLRADDILKLQCLPDDEKQKYRLIMQNFWNMVSQHPPGSQEHTTARQKLAESSQKFIARERQHRAKMKAQQLQGGQPSQGQPNQANAGGQQGQAQIKQEVPQPANRGAENAAAAASQYIQGQQPAPANPNANPNQARPQQQIDPAIIKHVHEFPIELPPNAAPQGTPAYETKLKEYRNGYLNMLAKQSNYAESRRKLNNQMQERQNAGQDVPQDMHTMKARIEKEHAQMKEQLDKFRRLQKQWKDEREQKERAQGGQPSQQPQGQNQAPQQPPQRQNSQPSMPTQAVKDEPQIKIEGGQMPQAQAQVQFNMQGNPQQQQPQPQQNQQMPPSMQQQQQQQARPPPTHAQTMPPGQVPQFTQPGQQPNFQQQQRPQINPMQANAHQNQQSNSPHPQSATGAAPGGPPVPLSHQAAVSAANRSYTDPQRTNTPMQQGQGNFGSREREQLNNPKMPIPRHLNVSSPTAVHMGQARPTMSGPTNGAPGPMGQPVIPRPPPFQLEGEGDRVLSKRKLDELVRQVTGGSEEALTPEVEEAVLQLADDFIDNVISSACKLSKLRESPQLDIRDIQVILERNYNIRIPGYASDEVRTVRKIVPAPGWAAKMNAVNAAKVMGGKADF